MLAVRSCSRPACGRPAAATLTYVYADSTVVVGQLATAAEPHSYDLCVHHAEKFTAPRGWHVVVISPEFVEPDPTADDLEALARAVREAGSASARSETITADDQPQMRGHLRILGSDAAEH